MIRGCERPPKAGVACILEPEPCQELPESAWLKIPPNRLHLGSMPANLDHAAIVGYHINRLT